MFNTLTRMGASGAGGDYEIERSLRLNSGDSPRLDRAIGSAGNTRTWTFSCWFKIGSLSTDISIFAQGDAGSQRFLLGVSNHELLFVDTTGSPDMNLTTTALLRDPSAWYHVVIQYDTTQSTDTDRCKMYLNGSIPTFKTSTYQTQNTDGYCNSTTSGMRIGANPYDTALSKFDGYLAEMHHIDGSIVPLSTFGETDAETGQWIPKKVTGVTYGTNGFYLDFSDNSGTTATTLGKDSSGNGNNFTPTNFSVAAGVDNDSMTDTPTNNFCTWNPLADVSDLVLANGNLNVSSGTDSWPTLYGTMGASSGKFYFEATNTDQTRWGLGWSSTGFKAGVSDTFNDGYFAYSQDPLTRYETGTNSSINGSPAFDTSKTLQVAIDITAGKIWYGINNTWVNNDSGSAGDPANGSNPISTFTGGTTMFPKVINNLGNVSVNWGQQGFTYTPPTGFETLSTSNLAEPTIVKSTDHFDSVLYTGNGTAKTITGLGFSPNLVWIKGRSDITNHRLSDTIIGTGKSLVANDDRAEATTEYSVSAFTSDGWTTTSGAGDTNQNGSTFVAWNWKGGGTGSSNGDGDITATVSANASAGFSIVKYTGNGSTDQYVGHGLGVTPELLFHKNLSATANWLVRTTVIDGSIDWAYLNNGNGFSNASAPYTNAWSSTKFSIGTDAATNTNAENYITYCFSSVEGYSRVGVYEGTNNSVTGPMIYCGFKPALLLIKNIDADARHWVMKTGKIHEYNTGGGSSPYIRADDSTAETTGDYTDVDLLSNGFKCRQNGSYINSAATFIYLAFAESPFKYANAR